VRDVCYAGLDGTALRRSVTELFAELLETDASSFVEIEPSTSIPKNSVLRGYDAEFCRQMAGAVTASPIIDFERRAARGDGTARLSELPIDVRTDAYARTLRDFGFQDDLHALLTIGRRPVGFLTLARRRRPRFSDAEVALMEELRSHLAAGLQAAFVLGPQGRIEVVNPAARELIAAPAAPDVSGGIGEVGAVLRTAHAFAEARGRIPAFGIVAAGRRYALRAERAVGVDGDPRTIVFLEPPQSVRRIEFLRLGLSPREAEIAAAVVRGERTVEIAAASGLSPNTIKTHVRSIFDKLDVRSRRELTRRFIRA
jgi:DNA-binding CsgD family transcriptional regulator